MAGGQVDEDWRISDVAENAGVPSVESARQEVSCPWALARRCVGLDVCD